MEIGYLPSTSDSLQVHALTELFSVIIQASSKPHTPEVGFNEYIYAIKNISLGIMGVESIIPCNQHNLKMSVLCFLFLPLKSEFNNKISSSRNNALKYLAV
jgi:hypothetical protein